MANATIWILKVVIALALAGSLVVQTMILPAIWVDMTHGGAPLWAKLTFISSGAGLILAMQVFAVCVWRLLTMVKRGSVFSRASFGYVNTIIGAFAAASVLAFLLAVLLAPGGIAPGLIGVITGASLVLAGIALLVVVMRRLLVQATQRETEVRTLRSELDEVI
ncbi:DUF2975 domain-containing protein [Leucobacter sp. USHLN153]|uniref:DUF2975 domain-containing protein n=1 Tax=Leucobacter sp. USHLN153 TaxID=3081268 RepID=UPI00301AF4FB